jgi:PAS domain S-box-containing protein
MGVTGLLRRVLDADSVLLSLARTRADTPFHALVIGTLWAAVVLLIRFLATPFYQEITGFVILVPGVILAALTGGRIAGVWTTLLCLAGGWFLVGRVDVEALSSRLSYIATINFLIVGVFATIVGASLRKTLQRLDASVANVRESEERFRLMADSAPSPVWLTNADGEVEFVNKALLAFFGRPVDDVMGGKWQAYIHPDEQADVIAVMNKARPQHQTYSVECRFLRKDGAWRWSSLAVNPRFDGQGVFQGYVGMAFDITETRDALNALARQDRRQSFLLALGDSLREMSNADAIMAEASRRLGENLDCSRVCFGEIHAGDGVYRLYPDWTDGRASASGDLSVEAFGDLIQEDLQQGLLVTIDDVKTDPRTAAVAEAYQSRETGALAIVPLMRAGNLRAFLSVESAEPRIWTAEELGLVDEVSERVWAEVERAWAQAEVVESEARFRAVSDTTPVLIWVTAKDGSREFVNQAYIAFRGGDYETARSESWRDLLHPDDRDEITRQTEIGMASGQPFSLEARYRGHSGEYRRLRSFSRQRVAANGELVGYVGVAFDVTDLHESNTRLAALAAERDAILGQLGEGVLVCDATGTITYVNDAARRMHDASDLNLTPTQTSAAFELITEDGSPHAFEDLPLVRAALYGEHTTEARWRVRRTDGSEVIAVGNARPLIGPDGERMGAVLTLRDETDRIVAEHRISESEARFRTVADSAPVFIWMTDAETRIIFANERYRAVFGVDTNELLGGRWRKRIHPDDLEPFTRAFLKAMKTRSRFEAVMRVTTPASGEIWLRSEGIPRFDASGAFEGYVGASLDITSAKRAEDDLKRINELLEERVGEALAEKAKAEADLMHAQRMEAVGRLTGGVAHDFNNLLTVVIGALDMILRSPDDAARRKKLGEAALAAARRGEGLTHQLLAFSRRQALRPQAIDLNALIGEGEPLLRKAVGEAIDFRLDLADGEARVSVDPAQFEAALLNLLVNARDAVSAHTARGGGRPGRITVTTDRRQVEAGEVRELAAGPYVCVTMTDNGDGMDEATLARVFEPFFTTKAVGKGTGLGLSQVYGFARQSGGGVRIASVPGEGSQIHLYLPPLNPAEPLTRTDERTDAVTLPSGRRILLVEDDAGVSAIAVELLTRLGLKVVAVETAPDALDRLAETRFDVMLSDIVMPGGMTGIELARLCAERYPDLRILLTSGYAGDDVDEALTDAPWPLLRKPYSGEQLHDALSDLLPIRPVSAARDQT